MIEYGVDLHVHSNYSDGELSPNDLIKKAYNNNINLISITDHDTVDGLKNMYNDNNLVSVIPGIELSAKTTKGTMHILGYGIDICNNDLNLKLKEIKDNNINYIISILAVLKKEYDISFNYEEIKKLVNTNHNLNRVDIARLCVNNGYVDNVQDAFNKYLKEIKNLSGYSKGIDYNECIRLIVNSSGIPVLAHPKTLNLNDNELYDLLKEMKFNGLKGVECYHSSHSKEETSKYLEMAKELNLLISGGSDFHGEYTKPDVYLGNINGEKIKRKELTIISKL